MKQTYLELAMKTISGLSGGIIAVYLISKYLGDTPERVSINRVIFGLFLGLAGAVFLAPIIISIWDLKGGVATGASFIVAISTEFILIFILKILQAATTNAPDILQKVLEKYLGKLPKDDEKDE